MLFSHVLDVFSFVEKVFAPIMTKCVLLVLWIIYTTELSVAAQNLGEYLYCDSHVS